MRKLFLSAALAVGLTAGAQNDAANEKKISDLIQKMTLEEKVGMIHASSSFTSGGVPRLGIPELTTSDGPHGVRPEHGRDWTLDKNVYDSGTYLPTGVCLAATWNPALGYAYGQVLGSEAAFRGKDVILGPGINILRSPLNGRNFEYQSEDPYLVSRMGVGYIKGVQDQGVSACLKHYAANNQEKDRGHIDVQMSERALREIYLPGFKAAVTEGGVNTVMGAYNKFRGQWATHNHFLVNGVLKGEWGFQGLLMSDWGAVHNTWEALWNGTDLEMGTDLEQGAQRNYGKFFLGDTVVTLVRTGRIPAALIDDKVRRILRVMYKTGMMDGSRKKGAYNTKEHQQTAARVAEEGIVLLKNEGGLLPLDAKKIRRLAVIGANALRPQSMGGGSSQVRAFYEVTPLQGLQALAGKGTTIQFAPGYKDERAATADAALIKEAAAAAARADVAIVVGGWTHGYNYSKWSDNAYDAEGTDKPDMHLPFGQDELIKAVVAANPRTVVVLIGGGPADLSAWAPQARGIVQAWYGGMEGGHALARILYGQVNPSGKLPMTFPKTLEDVPAHKLGQFPGDGKSVYYFDDIYVGYRYYDTYNVQPLFPFGHGLSYTRFAYSNIKVATAATGRATVTFRLKNTGKVAGAEVAQVYVHQQRSLLPRPQKELKGFQKVWLQPGEEKEVTVTLNEDAFQYYNDIQGRWVLETGAFDILAGGSSGDTPLKSTVTF
ncbi:glycoside hydrolase family 3 C-terminal domain-containing protein [Paraflavisolibacter sp. H34]|uniref:glycoside hydrolase family 3 C-terminal domain-containing protein n=1 Tax=Huijunlia imazamoxiresistens TaxID=3127457 RepID=UPI003016E8BA